MRSTRLLLISAAMLVAHSVAAQPGPPTQNVNVVNTPSVSVVNAPNVNVANTPGVNVLNTPLAVTVESAPAPTVTSHLGVPVDDFAGRLYNDFGGIGTTLAFGPGAAAINGPGDAPVQSGFDWVVTDIDYSLEAGGTCNPADAGKQINLTIAVGPIRHYLLNGTLNENCEFNGRDYMTAGFVVGEGQQLMGGANCPTCIGAATATLQLRGYVVTRPTP